MTVSPSERPFMGRLAVSASEAGRARKRSSAVVTPAEPRWARIGDPCATTHLHHMGWEVVDVPSSRWPNGRNLEEAKTMSKHSRRHIPLVTEDWHATTTLGAG
jgi:hypothetical protein